MPVTGSDHVISNNMPILPRAPSQNRDRYKRIHITLQAHKNGVKLCPRTIPIENYDVNKQADIDREPRECP